MRNRLSVLAGNLFLIALLSISAMKQGLRDRRLSVRNAYHQERRW